LVLGAAASASQLTYAPVNPTFGGNPLGGSYLLSTAQSQGFGKAGSGSSTPDLSGLDSALSNLGTNLGSGSISTPIIVIGTPTTPTIPSSP
jgi:curli production assembly/transport component CsgF